jgi:integral membrane protein (TIGR01906 family)
LKALQTATQVLFILCLPVLLLTASLSLAVNTEWLQHYGFEKYGISEVTGLARAELDEAAAGLIDYFNSGDENISLTVVKDGEPFELFNEREAGHLRDVKELIHLGYRVLLGTFVYALAFVGVSLFWWRDRARLGWGLVGGGALTLVLMVAIGLVIVFNFDQFFLQFHLISFANDLWMLDPTTDYLIMMFPRGFWFDAALFCAIVTAVLALILGGTGWWLKRRDRRAEA